ncbi:MAG: transcriptional repressor [Bacteroidota bacterium]
MKELERRLLEKQINPTAMRLVVLDYLVKQTNAVSLTDMELGMEKTDRVTLYRSIRTFEEHGLVHRIEDGTGVTKFAICQPACTIDGHHDLHVHFYCINCQETHCLPKTHIPEVKLPCGYELQETSLLVKGLCSECKR